MGEPVGLRVVGHEPVVKVQRLFGPAGEAHRGPPSATWGPSQSQSRAFHDPATISRPPGLTPAVRPGNSCRVDDVGHQWQMCRPLTGRRVTGRVGNEDYGSGPGRVAKARRYLCERTSRRTGQESGG